MQVVTSGMGWKGICSTKPQNVFHLIEIREISCNNWWLICKYLSIRSSSWSLFNKIYTWITIIFIQVNLLFIMSCKYPSYSEFHRRNSAAAIFLHTKERKKQIIEKSSNFDAHCQPPTNIPKSKQKLIIILFSKQSAINYRTSSSSSSHHRHICTFL